MLAWKIFLSDSKSLLFFELTLKLQVLREGQMHCIFKQSKNLFSVCFDCSVHCSCMCP